MASFRPQTGGLAFPRSAPERGPGPASGILWRVQADRLPARRTARDQMAFKPWPGAGEPQDPRAHDRGFKPAGWVLGGPRVTSRRGGEPILEGATVEGHRRPIHKMGGRPGASRTTDPGWGRVSNRAVLPRRGPPTPNRGWGVTTRRSSTDVGSLLNGSRAARLRPRMGVPHKTARISRALPGPNARNFVLQGPNCSSRS